MYRFTKNTFILTEVLIGAFLLATTFAVVLAIFVSARGYVLHSQKRIIAANLLRSLYNELYYKIRADNWSDTSGDFSLGVHNLGSVTIENISYNQSYTVSRVSGREYKQISITVTYPED